MDDRPDVIETQIARTRERLDYDLDRLDRQMSRTMEQVKVKAQLWGGISAVAAGAIAAIAFWPRRSRA